VRAAPFEAYTRLHTFLAHVTHNTAAGAHAVADVAACNMRVARASALRFSIAALLLLLLASRASPARGYTVVIDQGVVVATGWSAKVTSPALSNAGAVASTAGAGGDSSSGGSGGSGGGGGGGGELTLAPLGALLVASQISQASAAPAAAVQLASDAGENTRAVVLELGAPRASSGGATTSSGGGVGGGGGDVGGNSGPMQLDLVVEVWARQLAARCVLHWENGDGDGATDSSSVAASSASTSSGASQRGWSVVLDASPDDTTADAGGEGTTAQLCSVHSVGDGGGAPEAGAYTRSRYSPT